MIKEEICFTTTGSCVLIMTKSKLAQFIDAEVQRDRSMEIQSRRDFIVFDVEEKYRYNFGMVYICNHVRTSSPMLNLKNNEHKREETDDKKEEHGLELSNISMLLYYLKANRII